MSDAEPLLALLELMLRTFSHQQAPKVKPGGHPDEIFVDLSEEERDTLECSICYQILKDVRQCENKHKFCYSCIFVWSTSGHPINHSRCPVCRVDGSYVRNYELDEIINDKKVKCSLKTCKWSGALKSLQSHQHTTYTNPTRVTQPANEKATELPAVRTTPVNRPSSVTRSRSSASGSLTSTATSSQVEVANETAPQIQFEVSLNNTENSINNSTTTTTATQNATRSSSNRRSNGNGTSTRSRTRSRHRHQSSSPQRRSHVTATGLNTRLTSRARIQNNGTVENQPANATSNGNAASITPRSRAPFNRANLVVSGNINASANVTEQTTIEELHVPHPPMTPRPTAHTPRRLPTLPNLISMNNNNTNNSDTITEILNPTTDSNNNVSGIDVTPESVDTPRRFVMEATIRRSNQPRSFGMIRERLNESRQRLDMLMSVFSTELDRGRHDLVSFQQERERRRQEQLAEVRELGHRLSQVASELRGLLSQRREIRTQMDHLLESAADDQD